MKSNIQAIGRILKQLNYIFLPEHKRRFVPLFLVILVSAAFELVGVTIILPFVQAVLTPEAVMENRFFKPFFEAFGISDPKGALVFVGICVILLYIVKNLFLIFSNYYQTDFASKVQMDLSIKTLNAFMKRPYVYYSSVSSAEISRGCGADVSAVYATLQAMLGIITEILSSLSIGMFIIITEPVIAAGTLVVMLVTMLIIIAVFKPFTKRLSKKNMKAATKQSKAMYQITQGIKEIYVTDRKKVFIDEYKRTADVCRKTNRNYNFMNASPDRIVEGVCVTGLMSIVLIRLLGYGDMTAFVPKLAAFAMAAFKLMPAIGKITSRINTLMFNQVRVDTVYENLKAAKAAEEDNAQYYKEHALEDYSKIDKRDFQNELELKNVYWQYDTANKPVLTDVNLVINKGEAVGIIGPSGAGKTTLVDMILGLYRPQKGGIYMDGVDVYTIPHEWAKLVGYVQQSVFLIDHTIRENVKFGKVDATDEEIWEALERASAADFVRELPDQLGFYVGERGAKLSGGQRQRIAIARALLDKPEILVLDEATSALDNETEKAIMESIDALQGQITMIIVAHRLTTIKNCDRLYEIKDGVATIRDKEEVLSEA